MIACYKATQLPCLQAAIVFCSDTLSEPTELLQKHLPTQHLISSLLWSTAQSNYVLNYDCVSMPPWFLLIDLSSRQAMLYLCSGTGGQDLIKHLIGYKRLAMTLNPVMPVENNLWFYLHTPVDDPWVRSTPACSQPRNLHKGPTSKRNGLHFDRHSQRHRRKPAESYIKSLGTGARLIF